MKDECKQLTDPTQTQQILDSVKQQENYAKRSLWNQRIRTVIVAIVALVAISMVRTVETTMRDVQLLTKNASFAVTDLLDTVEKLDIQNTLAGIDVLVSDSTNMMNASSKDIQKSLQAIADLNVEGLNNSIDALQAITTSIGRFFGYKG